MILKNPMMLKNPPETHPATALKIAFLTGLSNPQSCKLSPIQTTFLSSLHVPKDAKIYLNFPYFTDEKEHQTQALWKASIENTKQFLQVQRQHYQQTARRHLEHFSASTEKLIFLTGSCGLEILNRALSPEVKEKILHVFAYAPVARNKPDYPHSLIRGSRDYLSRFFFNQVDVLIPNMGHMGYLNHPRVFEHINEVLCSKIS